MFYQLPPAGNRIGLRSDRAWEAAVAHYFEPFRAIWYGSGTSALAAALLAARAYRGVDSGDVLLPAYGCPDLVSAALHAGLRPVPVDLAPERTWLDEQALEAAVTERTVAVVAVDLFGIPERSDRLMEFARRHTLVLIQDSAQLFPGGGHDTTWYGDLIVLSFGRGKPVSLLGGGAVLCADANLWRHIPRRAMQSSSVSARSKWILKAVAYNLLLSPRLYWLPESLPFLGLGKTSYRSLPELEPPDTTPMTRLPANLAAYRERQSHAQQAIARVLGELQPSALLDLPTKSWPGRELRLLRYPILTPDTQMRDQLYRALRSRGLGPSRMYPAALPDLPDVRPLLGRRTWVVPWARAFAERVLTMPTSLQFSGRDADLLLLELRGLRT